MYFNLLILYRSLILFSHFSIFLSLCPSTGLFYSGLSSSLLTHSSVITSMLLILCSDFSFQIFNFKFRFFIVFIVCFPLSSNVFSFILWSIIIIAALYLITIMLAFVPFSFNTDHIFLLFCMFSNFELCPRYCECYILWSQSPCYNSAGDCCFVFFFKQAVNSGSDCKFCLLVIQITSQNYLLKACVLVCPV